MNNYHYEFERFLFILWKAKRVHIMGWTSGVGYGFTKKQAKERIWKGIKNGRTK